MTFTKLQNQILPQIETRLIAFIESQTFGRSRALKNMLREHMGWGEQDEGDETRRGKRIRPLLMLLCACAFNVDIEDAMPAALAVELLHNFTLIHDDIQDQSPLRHGRPTLWRQYGTAQAINAGDALFAIAQMAILELVHTRNERLVAQAALKLNQVCLQLTRGQYLDIAFETDDEIEIETYLDMIRGKTAALIAFSASLGGMVARQHPDMLDLLSNYGESLGMAFQIQDDYLGVWGDPAVTGKSTASDLLAKKKSLPVLYGLQHCPEFHEAWRGELGGIKTVDQLAEMLRECGAEDYVKEQSEIYTKRAFETLNVLFLGKNEYSQALFQLTEKLLHRQA